MQERNVLILVVVLVVATAGAGVAVNAFRGNDAANWRAVNMSLGWTGTPQVGGTVRLTVRVAQGMVDARTLGFVFLSVDVAGMAVSSATPSSNPWDCPTVWNLTGKDLSTPLDFNVTAVPQLEGTTTVYAMVWAPLGDLRSVSVDAGGHVNTGDVSLMQTESATFVVTAAP